MSADYGRKHRKLRAQLAPIVALGQTMCSRYGHPQFPKCPGLIRPDEPWDLGHDDDDSRIYTGPEHRYCNRHAGLLKGLGKLRGGDGFVFRDW